MAIVINGFRIRSLRDLRKKNGFDIIIGHWFRKMLRRKAMKYDSGLINLRDGESAALSEETLYRINPEVQVGVRVLGFGDERDGMQNFSEAQLEDPNEIGDESVEEDSLIEAKVAKEVWGCGGLSFEGYRGGGKLKC
ncbi:hypothetical protein PIB30_064477 [Stylosanthes scabra]|uniref:Uncharacterized protein n=1 Tax=Stylosanthes scabra TaxID=79078 RepID=A0ABU6ZKF4_9FABA|nr:hypothetical protein [Stylosanthes scabra]